MVQALAERTFDAAGFTDEHLLALTTAQRRHLARRLAALDPGTASPSPASPSAASPSAASPAPASSSPAEGTPATRVTPLGFVRRHLTAIIALGAFVAMIPWTARLAATLPDRYVITHWSTTWVGFDTLLALSFAITAWATWRRRQALFVACVITATLLACDAWFDITTASTSQDMLASAITAAVGELPLAGLLLWLGTRSRRTR